jgi:hypothetical protein
MIAVCKRTAPLEIEEPLFHLHGGCFNLWNEERQKFKPSA